MATGGRLRAEGLPRTDALGRAVAGEVAARLGWTAPRPASLVAGAQALLVEVAEALADGRPPTEVRVPSELHRLATDAVHAGVGRGLARELARSVHRGACTMAYPRVGADAGTAVALSAWLIDHLGAVEDELERLLDDARAARGSGSAQRAALVREVLDGRQLVDERAASARLRYDLRRSHVGVLGCGGDVERVEAAVERVARAVGSAWLSVRRADGSVAAWAMPTEGDLRARVGTVELTGAHVVLSGPRAGLAGFRSVHADVVRAARAVPGPDGRGGPTWFADVHLEALLLGDEDAARAFVQAELGELLHATDEHLLDTLEAVLEEDGDHPRAAGRLGVDPETVAHRLQLIEELLGTPRVGRRLETRVALRLRRRYTAWT